MKIKFLGGADIVGRMGMLVQNKGATLIFEYGMRPSKPPEYPLASPPVDMAFLTHCHLDHSGMIPGYAGNMIQRSLRHLRQSTSQSSCSGTV